MNSGSFIDLIFYIEQIIKINLNPLSFVSLFYNWKEKNDDLLYQFLIGKITFKKHTVPGGKLLQILFFN